MLIWNATKSVMHVLKTKGRQVTIHVEGIEMRLEGGILPLPFSRHAYAAVL